MRRPIATVCVCVLLAAASVALTVWKLEFHSDRSELVDTNLDFQKRYADFRARFPRWDDAVVVVDLATAASPEIGEAFVAELEKRLRADTTFAAVTAGFHQDEAPAGLIFAEPLDSIRGHVAKLKQASIVLNSPTLDGLLGMSTFAPGSLSAEQRTGLVGLLQRTVAAGKGERSGVLGIERGVQRLVNPGGSLATVLVSVKAKASDEEKQRSIGALRAHLRAVQSEERFSSIQAGVTGVPVLEADETALSTRDGQAAGVLALVGIVLLMLVAYRGIVVPLLAASALLIGVAWSFAWATLAVGHLQLLSVTFASLLMGLGIDVAIHIIARLELVHPDHDRLETAIARALQGVGPGIVTATITVAVAAAAMAFTPFAGVAEMGIIAAGGVVLCTIAIMFSLPAMLVLVRNPGKRLRTHSGGESRPFLGTAGVLLYRFPGLTISAASVVFAVAAWWGSGTRYDTDLQNLMPDAAESVRWQKRLEAEDSRSVWHAVVLAKDESEARTLTSELRALPEVAGVGGAGILYPAEDDLKTATELLRSLPDQHVIRTVMETAEPRPEFLRKVAGTLQRAFSEKDRPLAEAAAAVAGLSDDQLLAAMNAYETDRQALASTFLSMHDATPPAPDQLPEALRDTMIGADGSLLLRVYPRVTAGGALAPETLGPFVRAVLAAAPAATGPSVQIYESTSLITGAYRTAAWLALAGIFVILLIDFRHIGDALCAMLPVLMGAALMLAVMRSVGIALNLANLIVMPLIVGIGVGCGVHAVKRWRLQPRDLPPGLAGGSGRAITLTTLTTIIGFAVLIAGEHRGIRSLGVVMSLGLAMVYVVTILVLPSILRLRSGRNESRPSLGEGRPVPDSETAQA